MAVVIWAWTKHPGSGYRTNGTGLRSALALAPEDVRVQAAWMFLRLFKDDQSANSDAEDAWLTIGPKFFAEVWPLEPALQSARSGNHFAEVPTRVPAEHFAEAVDEVLPYIRPFEIWSVKTELGLDLEKEASAALIDAHPTAVLRLLVASISNSTVHNVYELRQILDRIASRKPTLERDQRMRTLRRIAGDA